MVALLLSCCSLRWTDETVTGQLLGSSCSTWADVVGGQREACKCLRVWELLDLCVSGVKDGSSRWEIAGGAL